MRIIGGKYAGRVLHVPPGLRLRPTTDRAKEALFNILINQFDFEGLRVLELYAGTGALGLEALSRGAIVTTVERNPKHCRLINEFMLKLDIESRMQVICSDVKSFISHCKEHYHLIIADPPYDDKDQISIIHNILQLPLLEAGGTLVWEHRAGLSFGAIKPEKTKEYGESAFSFFNGV